MKPHRSVRALVVGGALVLTLLPLLLLLVAYAYESLLLARYHAHLEELSRAPLDAPLDELGRRDRVRIQLLDGNGALVADSHTDLAATSSSLIGGFAEQLVEVVEPHVAPERLGDLDAAFGPFAARDEVQRALTGQTAFARRLSPSGVTVVFSLAAPRVGGGVLYLSKASRRGVRRLLVVRDELLKLTAYQLVFGIAFSLLIGRGLALPLERLAKAVRRYPQQPLADPALLRRGDEIGELARAVRAMAEDLEQRRRATAELGADVAHEFKNPLATIAASAELIGSTVEASPDKRRLVSEHILASVERLRRAIDALLALLRLEEALPDEPRARLDYHALVESVLDEYRRDPRWAGVTLAADVSPGVGEVTLLPSRWAELLRNLLDNALVQPSERREVRITVERDGSRVTTRVRDFGPGVSAGNQANVFRRFYSRRPAGAAEGTGLGLSIVQAVAAAHGGTVVIAPTDGPGATFRVTLEDARAPGD